MPRLIVPAASLLLVLAGAALVASATVNVHAPPRAAVFDETLPDVAADEHTRPMEGIPPEHESDGMQAEPDGLPAAEAETAAPPLPASDDHDSGLVRPAEPPLPPLPPAAAPPMPLPPQATPTAALPPLPPTVNIVLLGSDRRPAQKHWRTDTIIVVMLNPQTKEAGVISLHRDLWVNTPKGATKINTVDYGLGAASLKQTLGALLGVPIDYYVRIEFDGMVQAIDALGGITVQTDCAFSERYEDAGAPGGVRSLQVPAGSVPFSGQMALDYARSRLSSSVSDRMKRQMSVLLGVREKVLSPETFVRIPELWDKTKGLVQTDLPPALILPLAKLASELALTNAHGLTVNERFGRVTYSPQRWWIIAPDVHAIRVAARGIFGAPPLATSVKGAGC